MRRRSCVLIPLVVALGLVATPARVDARTGEATEVVTTEAEYRTALTTLAADNSGPHTITLGADITITGGTDPAYTGTQPLTIDGNGFILSGGDTRRVLTGSAGGALLTLTDITVRDGFSAGDGGAVRWTGPAAVEAVEMVQNHASGAGNLTGGALAVEGATTIRDSTFESNSVTSTTGVAQGGAVSASPGVHTITIERSTFRYNAVVGVTNGRGGAVRSFGDITVTDGLAVGNTVDAASAGGGFLDASLTATLTRAQVYDHLIDGSASAAGGALSGAAGVSVVDSTIVYNEAHSAGNVLGSALYSVGGGVIDLVNTTVAENVGTGATVAGAVYTVGTVSGEHATIVDNSGNGQANLRSNSFSGLGFVLGRPGGGGTNCLVDLANATYSVDDDGTCGLVGGTGNASDVADIGLGPLRDNGDLLTHPDLPAAAAATMFPLAGSPVVDRIPTGTCALVADQRGVARPFGTGCDAGAIEAVFPAHGFTDVPAWVEDAVRWMARNQFMTGITDTTFVPNDPITRGQVVRMLYREAGSPDVSGYPAHGFTDVPGWVEDAVRWAKGEDIATGITATIFKPNDPISRAQVTRMKYRFAGSPPVGALPAHPFTDVPAWVQDAVRWAANTNNPLPLATGITATLFKPNDPITRGQVARMDYRLAITPAAWADPEQAPSTMPFRPFVL